MYLVDLRQLLNFWSVQDSQSQANHLQILTSGCCGDVSWLRPHIVDNALLQPRDEKMSTFIHDCILHSRVSIEDDRSSATLDIVNRLLEKESTNYHWYSCCIDSLQCVGHLDVWWSKCLRLYCYFDVD